MYGSVLLFLIVRDDVRCGGHRDRMLIRIFVLYLLLLSVGGVMLHEIAFIPLDRLFRFRHHTKSLAYHLITIPLPLLVLSMSLRK